MPEFSASGIELPGWPTAEQVIFTGVATVWGCEATMFMVWCQSHDPDSEEAFAAWVDSAGPEDTPMLRWALGVWARLEHMNSLELEKIDNRARELRRAIERRDI